MPFLRPGDLERAGLDGGLRITNLAGPPKRSVLRTSLRPGLLRSIAQRVASLKAAAPFGDRSSPGCRFTMRCRTSTSAHRSSSRCWPRCHRRSTRSRRDVLDQTFFTLLEASEPSGLHPTSQRAGADDGVRPREVGEVHPVVLERYGIAGRAAWL